MLMVKQMLKNIELFDVVFFKGAYFGSLGNTKKALQEKTFPDKSACKQLCTRKIFSTHLGCHSGCILEFISSASKAGFRSETKNQSKTQTDSIKSFY